MKEKDEKALGRKRGDSIRATHGHKGPPPSQKPEVGMGTAHCGGGGRLGVTPEPEISSSREGEFPDDSIQGRTKSLMISPISKQRGLDSLLTQLG